MRIKAVAPGLFVAIVAIGVGLELVWSFDIARTTGSLRVTTSDSAATLAISGPGQQAKYIGRDEAHIRLKPGVYLVSAADQGTTVTASVQITKGQSISKTLNITGQLASDKKNKALIKKLPYYGPASSYVINYYYEYVSGIPKLVITVSSSLPMDQAKTAVSNWMNFWNFKASDYNIQYSAVPALGTSVFGSGSTQ